MLTNSFFFLSSPKVRISHFFLFLKPFQPAIFLLTGTTFYVRHICKFVNGGPGSDVLGPGVSTFCVKPVGCAISCFRCTRVCNFWLYTNLFMSDMQEHCSVPVTPPHSPSGNSSNTLVGGMAPRVREPSHFGCLQTLLM